MIKLKFTKSTKYNDTGFAEITIGDHGCTEKGWPLLSGHCVSYAEVENEVNRLKRDLDKVLTDTKRRFAAQKVKMTQVACG